MTEYGGLAPKEDNYTSCPCSQSYPHSAAQVNEETCTSFMEKRNVPSGKHVREMYTPLYPIKFYTGKVGYAGVYLFFLFLLQNIDCGYSLEPPRGGGSNVYPQSMF